MVGAGMAALAVSATIATIRAADAGKTHGERPGDWAVFKTWGMDRGERKARSPVLLVVLDRNGDEAILLEFVTAPLLSPTR